MAIIKQSIYSNISPYPKSWYQASGNWTAKSVSVADRYKISSPAFMQVDVDDVGLTLAVSQDIDLSVATNWGVNVTTRQNDTQYNIGDVIPTPETGAYYWECTTAGISASSDPGSWGTAVGNTKSDGTTLVWTCRYANPTIDASRAGQDFYIYACHSSDGSNRPVFKVSPNSTYPWGYSSTTSRKIGGFHCLCVSMSTPATWATGQSYAVGKTVLPTSLVLNGTTYTSTTYPYWYRCIVAHSTTTYSTEPTWGTTIDGLSDYTTSTPGWVCESRHSAAGYLAGDIIPNSVWDLKHRASSGDNTGLAYVAELDDWAGIYYPSGTTAAPTNVYGGTIIASTNWNNAVDVCRLLKARLPRDSEFQVFAILSNEQTNISTGAVFTTTGGHSDTQGRRMLSKYFLEDCCGGLWQWLADNSYRFDAATVHTHNFAFTGDAENPTAASGNASVDVAPAWAWSTAVTGYKGQSYKQGTYGTAKLVSGGRYDSAANSGSRARDLQNYSHNTSTGISFRIIVSNKAS